MSRSYATTRTGMIVPEGVTEPLNPVEGQMFINTVTNSLEVYYAGSWQVIFVFAGLSYLLLQDSTPLLLQDGTGMLLNA